MSDPLADIVGLLKPGTPFSKLITAAGPWRIRRRDTGKAFYVSVLQGRGRLQSDGGEPRILEAGDFALVPETSYIITSSVDPEPPEDLLTEHTQLEPGAVRLGRKEGPPDFQALIGKCVFGSPDASLLVPLLPEMIVVRGEARLEELSRLVRNEAWSERPARDVVLERLLELLLIEALRSTSATASATPGLLRGLEDERLAQALRRLHAEPTHNWTAAALAREAGLSRSTFFTRFTKAVGIAPMEYLLTWRMALAKDHLRKQSLSISEVALAVGYSSASAFSTAFVRHVGVSPGRYASEPV